MIDIRVSFGILIYQLILPYQLIFYVHVQGWCLRIDHQIHLHQACTINRKALTTTYQYNIYTHTLKALKAKIVCALSSLNTHKIQKNVLYKL